MNKLLSSKVVWITILAVSIGGLAFANLYKEQDRSKGIPVTGEILGRKDIVNRVAAKGEVNPLKETYVKSELAGRIDLVEIEVGDTVKTGDLLFEFSNESLLEEINRAKQQLASAELALAQLEKRVEMYEKQKEQELVQAEARYTQAKIDYDRVSNLPPWDASRQTAEKRLEEAKAALELAQLSIEANRVLPEEVALAKLNVDSAREQILRANTEYSKAEVYSPENGLIMAVNVREGDYVNKGSNMATVADVSSLRIIALVDEIDIGKVSVGQQVEITTLALVDEVFYGEVSFIAPEGVKQGNVVTFNVEVITEDPKGLLRTGMTVDANFVLGKRENVLVIPSEAILERDGKTGVFVNEEGVARWRPISTGLRTMTEVEVLSGLNEYDEILVGRLDTLEALRDGDAIEVIRR